MNRNFTVCLAFTNHRGDKIKVNKRNHQMILKRENEHIQLSVKHYQIYKPETREKNSRTFQNDYKDNTNTTINLAHTC